MAERDREGGRAAGSSALPARLEARVEEACSGREAWPEQIGAGIVAGVEFAIERPAIIDQLTLAGGEQSPSGSGPSDIVRRLAQLISRGAPTGSRLPGSTDEALVAGIVGLVGDHIKVGRFEALAKLVPDLILLALLPYLGFDEARRWANNFAGDEDQG